MPAWAAPSPVSLPDADCSRAHVATVTYRRRAGPWEGCCGAESDRAGGIRGRQGRTLASAGQGWDSPAGPGPWKGVLGWTEHNRVRTGHPRGPGPGAGGSTVPPVCPRGLLEPSQAVAPPEPSSLSSPSPYPCACVGVWTPARLWPPGALFPPLTLSLAPPSNPLFLSPRVLEWVAQCPLPPEFS